MDKISRIQDYCQHNSDVCGVINMDSFLMKKTTKLKLFKWNDNGEIIKDFM